MSTGDSTRRFCPRCEAETTRGYRGKCNSCAAKRQAKYRSSNPEKVKAGIDAWRVANKEKANAASRAWAAANPERTRANNLAWQLANPTRPRYKTSPEANRINCSNRRARRNATGQLSRDIIAKLLKLQRGRCACCGGKLGKGYHLDHVMPLARGGTNTDANMQLLHATCNLRKNAHHPVDFMQRNGFLL